MTPSKLQWRQSATPAGHAWFVLETSEPTTNGRVLGSSDATSTKLPTPMASDGMKDGAGGGAGSTYPFRQILATPRKTDADRGFRGDVLSQLNGYPSKHAGMLPTPLARDLQGGARYDPDGKRGISMREIMTPRALERWEAETLPTPTKRDKRMDAWSPAYDKRKSPTMDAVLDGAMTNRAPDKWAYARQIAAMLSEAGLAGPSQTLPITYGWMMGYPPGWLASALISAMAKGSLLPASSSRRSATPSSRKSPKRSAAPSCVPNEL
jgi:hypothetical protein